MSELLSTKSAQDARTRISTTASLLLGLVSDAHRPDPIEAQKITRAVDKLWDALQLIK